MDKKDIIERKGEEDVIYLIPIFKALWKKAWLIFIVSALCGALAFAMSKLLITPTYQTGFDAYVNNRNANENITSVSSMDISASQSLGNTYAEIITSRSVLTAAAKRLNLNCTYEELSKMVTAKASNTTGIITVSVVMETPVQAVTLASAVASVSKDYVAKIVEGSSMQTIDSPIMPNKIYSPNYIKNTLIGLIIGFVIICFIVIVKELLNDRIRDSAELEARFAIPVIGKIPDFASTDAEIG